MSINNLISCVYCGHKVSPSALACPSCNKHRDVISGVICLCCGNRVTKEMAITVGWDTPDSDGSWPLQHCESCVSAHYTPTTSLNCPDCGTQMPELSGLDILRNFQKPPSPLNPLSCKSCGCQRIIQCKSPGHNCQICHGPIFQFQESYTFKIKPSTSLYHAHRYCKLQPDNKSGCMLGLLSLIGIFVMLLILHFNSCNV